MSFEGPSERFPGPRGAQPAYTYPPHDNHRRMSYPTPPSLPPMSSLLSRHEQIGRMPEQQTYQTPSHAFQPQCVETKHPLFLSEMNPSDPVQHIYHAPQERAHVPDLRAEPVLVPTKPATRPSARPERVPIPPLSQQRQSKKIGQRRDEVEKDYVEVNSSLAAAEQGCSNEPNLPHVPRPQDPSPYAQRERDTKSFELSTPPETSLRTVPPSAFPFSNILSSSASGLQPNTTSFNLTVRQQPIAARACGFGERDRRVIDPPPILQLVLEDPKATPGELNTRLRQVHLVVHCTLWDPATDADASSMPGTTDKRQQRRLMGTLVSSPFIGKDEFNVEGCFFTFPDLSVRTPGTYSLKFSLIVIDPHKIAIPGNRAPINAVVKSGAFNVFNAKDFGGMRASTELTKRLKYQGCLISVKKGNTKSNHARDEDDDEDDEEDVDQDDMTKLPAAKRNKSDKTEHLSTRRS